jgi:hypothetical protein
MVAIPTCANTGHETPCNAAPIGMVGDNKRNGAYEPRATANTSTPLQSD